MTAREPYPLPSHAATIWLTGDCLAIAKPNGGTEFIPLRECRIAKDLGGKPLPAQAGWQHLIDTLYRLKVPEEILNWQQDHTITKCPPGQRSIDEFNRAPRRPAANRKPRTTLEDLA